MIVHRRWSPTAGRLALTVAGLLALTACSGPRTAARPPSSPSVSSSPGTGTSTAASPTPGGGSPGSPSGGLTTVTAVPARVLPPVPVSSPAPFGNGVTARITGSSAVTSQGSGIGQIAGAPAVAVTLEVRNDTGAAVPLRLANVTASYGPDATPGVPVDGPPGRPLPATLAPGGTATGTYVFAIPVEARGAVTLTVNLQAAQPTVVFTGPVG